MRLALRRRPETDLDHIEIVLAGTPLRVALRRSAAARRLTLRVSQATGEVFLTLPARTALSTARSFAESHQGWIASRLSRLPEQIPFQPGAVIPIRGEPHEIVHRAERSGITRVEAAGEMAGLSVSCGASHVGRRVRDFLVREVRQDLQQAIAHYTPLIGRSPVRITVRDTRSRWGSCTAGGELNFSWRLVLAPPYVLDYLVAHEMSHLREMNHSNRFWTLLGEVCPRMKEAEVWLKRHGASLHRYG